MNYNSKSLPPIISQADYSNAKNNVPSINYTDLVNVSRRGVLEINRPQTKKKEMRKLMAQNADQFLYKENFDNTHSKTFYGRSFNTTKNRVTKKKEYNSYDNLSDDNIHTNLYDTKGEGNFNDTKRTNVKSNFHNQKSIKKKVDTCEPNKRISEIKESLEMIYNFKPNLEVLDDFDTNKLIKKITKNRITFCNFYIYL